MINDKALRLRKEVEACRNNFWYFATRYAKLSDINGKICTIDPFDAQKEIISGLNTHNNIMILKARKLGSSTVIALYFLWKVIFWRNTKCAVVAHDDKSAEEIFEIYKFAYRHLPKQFQIPTIKSRSDEMRFKTGSQIKVGTADSERWRSQTYQYIHASEYAFWKDPQKTMSALFGTAGKEAKVIMESTANGLNAAHELWIKENGWNKIFLNWLADPRMTMEKQPYNSFSDEEDKFAEDHGLTPGQKNWMAKQLRTKCGNNWDAFNQEHPVTAELSFIVSGARFFKTPFPYTDLREGYEQWHEPLDYRIYTMGVDTASGSPGGDYSAFMVLDVTKKHDIKVCSSFYDRVEPALFKEIVDKEAQKYHDQKGLTHQCLIVVETTGGYGIPIIEKLRSEHRRLYRRIKEDKAGGKWTELLGFNTNASSRQQLLSRVYEYITRGWLDMTCPTFLREANALIYNKRGRVEASPGNHDDMIFACGLALMGLDQIHGIKANAAKSFKPRNIRQMLDWERRNGRGYVPTEETDLQPFHEVG